MAYFSALGGTGGTSATITVTYSEDFYGLTITATNGTTTLTKTATSSGTLVFDVSEGGTWVVSGTVEGATYSESVDVTFEYTAPPLVALPNGSTALPINDIQMWLKCAGIRDKTTYTTLADVLGDTDTLIALCADSNACDYMARSTTWASGVAADSTAMLIVGKYNYCANKLISNATWCEALAGSSYWEYIFNGCVPKMTSNTAPSGEVTGTTPRDTTTYALWKAFDRDTSTIYSGNVNTAANNTGGGFIQYHHTEPVCIKGIKLQSHTSNVYPYKSVKVEVSNDGSTYDTIFDDSVDFVTGFVDTSDNIKTGTYTKVTVTQLNDTGSSTYFPRITDCQFYGRTPVSQTHTLIHSAVEDNIFYMDEGTPVALCAIASGDTEDVDMESFKGQTLTLVSTVAKDPTNLSNDYSKSIRITPNITEIYLMPDNVNILYWYGHEDNLEDMITANGWASWGSGSAYENPTHNKNSIDLTPSGNNKVKGVTSKNNIGVISKLCAILNTTAINNYARLMLVNNKSFAGQADKYFTQTGLQTVVDNDSTSNDRYAVAMQNVYNNSVISTYTLYALWYE